MHFSEQNNVNESKGVVDKDIQGEVKVPETSPRNLIKDGNNHGHNQYLHTKAKTIRLDDTCNRNNNQDLVKTNNQ